MGKKSKNKKSRKQPPASLATTNINRRDNSEPKAATDANRGSLYSIYKHCTNSVVQWGKSTYRKLTKKPNQNLSETDITLSQLIFHCLGSVAKAKIAMPEGVLKDLRTAISYRKRVHAYYQDVPTVTIQDHDRHKWLIVQLERLEKVFSSVQQEDKRISEAKMETDKNFKLLSLDSEDEDDEQVQKCGQDFSASESVVANAPTPQELQEEERKFAVALALAEIYAVREKLRTLWGEWGAKKHTKTTNEVEDACELMATTACTEYLLMSITKVIKQTSLLFGDDIFSQILQSYKEDDLQLDRMTTGDVVTLRNLMKKPELNGRKGKLVTSTIDSYTGRIGVRLLPLDPVKEISVKPANLMLSGNDDKTCARLSQIYHVVTNNFDFESIPKTPSDHGQSIKYFLKNTLLSSSTIGCFNDSLESGAFLGFLNVTVKALLPLWMSMMARYRRDERYSEQGDQNLVLMSYLKDYDSTRKVDFSLALALLVAIDCAFAAGSKESVYGRGERAKEAGDVESKALQGVYDRVAYDGAIQRFEKDGFNPKNFDSILEIYLQLKANYHPMVSFVPWISGAVLLDGCFLNLYASGFFVLHEVQSITTSFHLYWMLRSEGHLGQIHAIEAMIAMYPQRAFFNGGVPERGMQKYYKTWQLALGNLNPNSVQVLNGRVRARTRKVKAKDQSFSGLFVTQISRLRNVLQLKSIPTLDIDVCCEQLRDIARKEYYSIFNIPLMTTAVKLLQLKHEHLSHRTLAEQAFKSDDGIYVSGATTPAARVSDWTMRLADKAEKDQRDKVWLGLIAGCFRKVFQEEAESCGKEPEPLAFIPYVEIDQSQFQNRATQRSGTAK